MSDILSDSLIYRQYGWSLLPIRRGTKKPALPKGNVAKLKRIPADEHVIRDWFDRRDDLGVAVLLGPPSGGLTCRDFDLFDAYVAWKTAYPKLADSLPTVRTHRGMHVYCVTDRRKIVKMPDGEFRANGYCLLPPTMHPKGKPYCWEISPNNNIPRLDAEASGLIQPWIEDATVAAQIRDEHTINRSHQFEPYHSDSGEIGDVTEQTEQTEKTEQFSPIASDCSVCSVTLAEQSRIAIETTLPDGPGQRNRQVFELARALKAIAALVDANADDLRQYVQEWHNLALPMIRTKDFDETWIDFLIAWQNVTFPKGSEPISQLFQQVAKGPLPVIAERYGIHGIKLLVGLCEALQRASGAGSFFLACRTAGRLLGISHVQAHRWLWLLLHDRVIVCVKPGTKKKAARYRYTYA
ncbi:MAG: bifunctional DNA primase/polymerase [Planctomycetaceae bacterium]|nr:bifunctional DNA primase/polymerase [Planctomycetaceae bacterium]